MSDSLVTLFEFRNGPETLLRRVRHAVSDQRFIVKSVASGAPADRIAGKLRKEYDFAAAMNHPRILKPRDWDPTTTTITYDDAQGTLEQLVRQEGKLDPPVVARVLYQCLDALAYLHGQGYGHGGLNVGSVFVTPDGDVAIGDFVGYRLDRRGSGLPIWPEYPLRYRAPELIDITLEDRISEKERLQGSPPVVRTDLYSLGYLALQLLRPEHEFLRLFGVDASFAIADSNWDGWHGDVSRQAPKLDEVLYDVPLGLREVLQPLILKDPASRSRLSVQTVRDAIDRLGLMSSRKLPAIGRKAVPVKTKPEPNPERKKSALTDTTKQDRFILELTANDGSSRVFPARQSVVVGSGPGADLHIPHKSVAPRHAIMIHRGNAGWWVYDTRSNSFGTRVNEVSAANGAPVRTKRVVTFGSIPLTATVHRGFWFGPFLVAARLHSGSNGVVYRAIWSEKDNSEVAVRVFPPAFQADTDSIRRFFRSIPEAGQFRHPNIVSLYKGGFRRSRDGRIWYLVMKYMPGGSLRQRLLRGPLAASDVVRIGREISAALVAINERGMIHRNINPSCVLFNSEGSARLGDFLLCRSEELETFHKVTRAGDTLFHDHAYQSPEQILGNSTLTWHSDQYSLAACLYESLTGRPVVETADRGLPQILTSILHDPIPSASSVNAELPAALDEILSRALSKTPDERFPTPHALLLALSKCAI